MENNESNLSLPENIKHFAVTREVLLMVLDYLSNRPFKEALPVLNALQNNVRGVNLQEINETQSQEVTAPSTDS